MLKLTYFGLDLPNRALIDVPLDPNDIWPGGPEAYYSKEITYVDDTKSRKYRRFFHNPAYDSFISLPILRNEIDGEIVAIINIDSDIKNQFVSKKFISEKIFPALIPTIALIKVLHKVDNLGAIV